MSKFTSILPMTDNTPAQIATGALKVNVGQWFKRADGTKTQFVGLRSGQIGNFSDAGQGDGFAGRTQRFARARWHLAGRQGGLAQAVKTAPSSVDNALLGATVRRMLAR